MILRVYTISILLLSICLFTSCLDDNDKSETLMENCIGTVKIENAITYVNLDFIDARLYPTNLNSEWKDGTRVVVTFRIDKTKQNSDKYWDSIELLNQYEVPCKDIVKSSSDIIYGNDLIIGIRSKWITDTILNFDINYTASSPESHVFNLINDSEINQVGKDTIVLQFAHNAHNDVSSVYEKKQYNCFSLTSLLPYLEKKDSVVLQIVSSSFKPEKNNCITYKKQNNDPILNITSNK